jgi:secreted trypsin-like serine protease
MNIEIEDESVVIILGAHKFFDQNEKSRQRFVTKKFWIHENFSRQTIENDIAIVELPEPAKINEFVKTIKISTKKHFGSKLELAFNGWGFYNNSFYTSRTLQSAKMRPVPFKKCLKFKDNYYEKLTKNNICAIGRNDQKIAKICDGDS